MKTNEEKARELSKGKYIVTKEMQEKDCSYEGDYMWVDVKHSISKQCEQVAMEMAKWKDEQIAFALSFLKSRLSANEYAIVCDRLNFRGE